jgi:hypothetical protein
VRMTTPSTAANVGRDLDLKLIAFLHHTGFDRELTSSKCVRRSCNRVVLANHVAGAVA